MASLNKYIEKHDLVLDKLERNQLESLEKVLHRLERDIVSVTNKGLTVLDGKIVPEVADALALRREYMTILEQDFLGWAHKSIDGYEKAVEHTHNFLHDKGVLELGFFEADRTTLKGLKQMTFQGFSSIANEYLDVMANGVYQATLTGAPVDEMTHKLRQSINGVYINSSEDEAQELVEFVKGNKFNPAMEAQVTEAVDRLHAIYARDRSGRNLRRYASQMAHDSLMQFDGAYTKTLADEAGLEHFYYYGSIIRDSREHCVRYAGKTKTEEEWRKIWVQSWGGKAQGDIFVVRGGYRCRHHFMAVKPEWTGGD